MGPIDIAQQLAHGGRVAELSQRQSRRVGSNRVFRLWVGADTRILKVYGSESAERRERTALDALAGLQGLPVVEERGVDDDLHWALFRDAGQWSLGTLPENTRLAQQAGRIIRNLHGIDPGTLSNLARGIDQEWVSADFLSTVRRLERYRGRLGISPQLLDAARGVRPPFASPPRLAHTDPRPDRFLVDSNGNVTLVNWEWATLAPPEWDLSRGLWLLTLRSGLAASHALARGYGATLEPSQLDRWTVYHCGMMLVFEVENRLAGRLDDLHYLVAELQRAVAGSRTAA